MLRIFVRALRLPAAAVYLAAILWSPIAHAQTEAVASDPVIEAGHSPECSVLHVKSACTITSAIEGPGGLSATTCSAPPTKASIQATSSVSPVGKTSLPNPKSERGPPAPQS
jgi:hypothetical protein